jgi:hypothetical protein
MNPNWWEAPMKGSVLSFLKAKWKVSDTGSAHWASSCVGHCAVRPSIYGFWWPLRCPQTLIVDYCIGFVVRITSTVCRIILIKFCTNQITILGYIFISGCDVCYKYISICKHCNSS